MDWCATPHVTAVNHAPKAVINGDASKQFAAIAVRAGERVRLSAAGSSDRDGNRLTYRWFHYREAGTFEGLLELTGDATQTLEFVAPDVSEPRSIHIILEVTDDGMPSLTAYPQNYHHRTTGTNEEIMRLLSLIILTADDTRRTAASQPLEIEGQREQAFSDDSRGKAVLSTWPIPLGNCSTGSIGSRRSNTSISAQRRAILRSRLWRWPNWMASTIQIRTATRP